MSTTILLAEAENLPGPIARPDHSAIIADMMARRRHMRAIEARELIPDSVRHYYERLWQRQQAILLRKESKRGNRFVRAAKVLLGLA